MYICQICKKAPATIHLTDIHNNVKKEIHFCESCAAEKGFNLQGAANLPQLLGLAAKKGGGTPHAAQAKAADSDLVCLHCGSTWAHFSERGRLGCARDYRAFETRLRPLIANQIALGSKDRTVFHVGKRPAGRPAAIVAPAAGRPAATNGAPAAAGAVAATAGVVPAEERVRSLEKKIREAVAEENYEAAARFKNELDSLRGGKAE